MGLDVARIKKDFPLLQQQIDGHRLVYLDSAASSQKPQAVLDAMDEAYTTYFANVHRSVYKIAAESTERYEDARRKIATFINSPSPSNVVFSKNVTEAINLVAYSWGRANLHKGDVVVLTEMEHHANIVPWLMLKEERGIELRWLGLTDDYQLDLSDLDEKLDGAKLLSFTALSNVLGTITPIRELADAAHAAGALCLVDAAQYVPHIPTDVQALGCDFLGFTGHKMCGPTGIGVLWARRSLLNAMPPFLGGGDMIKRVTLTEASWNDLPWKFEAGTPSVAEGIGLGAAVDYLGQFGMDNVRRHERTLVDYAMEKLQEVPGIAVYGPRDPELHGGAISFTLPNIHPHDLATLIDREGIAVRAGHHCTQPLMDRLGVAATTRASFYIYNRTEEVDQLVSGIQKAQQVFA